MNDAIVVGAGPAGSASAIGLARAGARVLLLERTRETGDALCGGFLSWRTLARLEALGIDRARLGGQAVRRVRLFAGQRMSETALPAEAMGVSRLRLDGALQAAADAAGAGLERGVHASAIEGDSVQTRDGATLAAPAVFLAAGKHGFRGFPREPAAWQRGDPVLGLRLRLPAHPALDRLVGDAVELHLFDRGYAGLVRQEDGSGNLCLAVHKSRLDEAGGEPVALLGALGDQFPFLGERLAAADWTRGVDAIGHVPYGWRTADTVPGLQAQTFADVGNGVSFIATGKYLEAQVRLTANNQGQSPIVQDVTIATAAVDKCDIDTDGDVDSVDLGLIRAAIGQTPAAGDPRDGNADGKITINDVRYCTIRCTRTNCATQ